MGSPAPKWGLSGPATCLACLLLILLAVQFWRQPLTRQDPMRIHATFLLNETDIRVSHEVLLDTDVLVVQGPKVAGILLALHSCGQTPFSWWSAHTNCKQCRGLPEQLSIARQALAHGLAVVAPSAKATVAGCWDAHWPAHSKDRAQVVKVVEALRARNGWLRAPLYALGAADAGAMALGLARYLPLEGICVHNEGIPPTQLEQTSLSMAGRYFGRHPPTAFVHMRKDTITAAWIKQNIAVLHSLAVPVKEVEVAAAPITPAFLAARVPWINSTESALVYQALRSAALLDPAGLLLEDPRRALYHFSQTSMMTTWRWQQAIDSVLPASFANLQHSTIEQELNVAWAGHELVGDHFNEVFDWFQRPGSGSVFSVAATHTQAHSMARIDASQLP